MVQEVAVKDEYIASDSDLGMMLNYWRGWWRIFWRWHEKSTGFRVTLPHRHIAPYVECGKWAWGLNCWRLMGCFSCETHTQANARSREMFPDDAWPLVIEDILDAEILDD